MSTHGKKVNIDMVHGPLFSNVVCYTIPIILTGVLQLLFNAADLIVIGRFRGSESVGAVGATGSLTSLFINLFIGISAGVSVVAANAVGAKDKDGLHKTVHTAMPIAINIICAILLFSLSTKISVMHDIIGDSANMTPSVIPVVIDIPNVSEALKKENPSL